MLDAYPVAVKDIETGFYTFCPPASNNICDLADQHKHPAVFVLGNVWPESDHIPLNVPPFQGQYLAFTPARVIGKPRQILEVGRQEREESLAGA